MTSLNAQLPPSLLGLQPGDLIGRKYRVDGVIGEGGMGIVLAATHLDLERPVAIKVLRPALADREEIVARMLFEARVAAKIRSQHVARVLDVGRLDSGVPYIVMEYLDGSDLCTLLEARHRLPVALACDFVIQACEALAEAHAAGIIHRDLKPANLFVASSPDGSPIIKVLDFGISKAVGPATRQSPVTNPGGLGSPHYMAPEQMRIGQAIDARADIWALGAILYELVTGKLAFDAELLPVVCARVLEDEPAHACDLVADVTPALDAVIWRCLRKDPALRYTGVADLARELAQFGSPGSVLHAERVSRVSATTRERNTLPPPSSTLQSSRLPRSLAPTALTPSDSHLNATSERTATGVFQLVGRRRSSVIKRLALAATTTCAFALAFAAWNRSSFWPGSESRATARAELSMIFRLPFELGRTEAPELLWRSAALAQAARGFTATADPSGPKLSAPSELADERDVLAASVTTLERAKPAARWKRIKTWRKKPRQVAQYASALSDRPGIVQASEAAIPPAAAASRSTVAAAAFPAILPAADPDAKLLEGRK